MKRALLLVVVCSLAPLASAQGSERHGLLVGASIGLGNSSPDLCIDCKTGLVIEARLGAMLKPNLALLAALQYWPSKRLWLRAGIGAASVEREDPPRYDYKTTHLAGAAGIGFEVNLVCSTFGFAVFVLMAESNSGLDQRP